jgi:hypothetical protein
LAEEIDFWRRSARISREYENNKPRNREEAGLKTSIFDDFKKTINTIRTGPKNGGQQMAQTGTGTDVGRGKRGRKRGRSKTES